MADFAKLFEPGKIGHIEIKNRIVFAPCGTHYSSHYGFITEQQLNYYAERAKGGTGLIIVEGASCRKRGKPGRILVNDDKFIPGMAKLAKIIHDNGAKCVMQMSSHQGSMDEVDSASPSGLPHPFAGWSTSIPKKTRMITVADLEELAVEYGDAAHRIMLAGFDGVVIHGANGYLPCELLSKRFNKRTDAYGGTLRGRAKFLLDLARLTRERTAPDFNVLIRLMGSDRVNKPGDEGWGKEDTVELCKLMEEAGINCINITSGSQETPEWSCPPYFMPDACNVDVTSAVKASEIKTQIMISGKIMTPALAEQILQDGDADYICSARTLIADPFWPIKAQEGRVEDICPCICDDRCLEDVMIDFQPMSCTVNPMVGKEVEFHAKQPRVSKNRIEDDDLGNEPRQHQQM